jgi:hypothetical protein
MKHLFSTLFALMLTASTLCWETGAAQAAGDIDPKLRKPFIDHTLKYKDKDSGLDYSIYLDRFGGFERYFPCQFDHGDWWVTGDGRLCIKYESKRFEGFCLTPKIDGETITLSSTEGKLQTTAQFLDGNKTPLG